MLRWLAAPSFPDADRTRRARTFWIVAWGSYATAVALMVVVLLDEAGTHSFAWHARAFVVRTAAVVLLLELNRRGYTRQASWALVIVLAVLITERAWNIGGLRAPTTPLYLYIMMVGGLLLGGRGTLLAGIACAAGAGLLAVGEQRGNLPDPEFVFSPYGLVAYLTLILLIAAVVERLAHQQLAASVVRAERELAERRQAQFRLQLALDAGEIGIWEQDVSTGQLTADQRLFDFYGIPRPPDGTIDYSTWEERVHPDDRELVATRPEEFADGVSRTEADFRAVLPNGEIRFVHGAAALLPPDGNSPGRIVGVNLDITRGRLAELRTEQLVSDLTERVKELRLLHGASRLLQDEVLETPDLLQQLVQIMPQAWRYPAICEARIVYGDAVVTTPGWRDSPATLSAPFTTSAASGVVEVSYNDDPASSRQSFLPEERQVLESLTEMLVGSLELRRHQRDLEELVASRTAELADSLTRLQALERLRDDLVHMIVHDLRSPLMALVMNLRVARTQAGPDLRETIEDAVRAGESLDTMANALLDVSRLEEGRMPIDRASCDLSDLAADVCRELAPLDPDRVVECRAVLPVVVECDRALIRRVLVNLVSNAIHHTPSGGSVSVDISTASDRVRIDVRDEGLGVPVEARERIFEKFGSVAARKDSSYHSIGLGLAFCKLAIQAHEGSIGVEPASPRGSVFWFDIPVR